VQGYIRARELTRRRLVCTGVYGGFWFRFGHPLNLLSPLPSRSVSCAPFTDTCISASPAGPRLRFQAFMAGQERWSISLWLDGFMPRRLLALAEFIGRRLTQLD
jgi:hypothetical protein